MPARRREACFAEPFGEARVAAPINIPLTLTAILRQSATWLFQLGVSIAKLPARADSLERGPSIAHPSVPAQNRFWPPRIARRHPFPAAQCGGAEFLRLATRQNQGRALLCALQLEDRRTRRLASGHDLQGL